MADTFTLITFNAFTTMTETEALTEIEDTAPRLSIDGSKPLYMTRKEGKEVR